MPNAKGTLGSAVGSIVARVDARRRTGALDEARRAAEGALSQQPYDADLHDVLARVLADAGELQLARDAWETARTLKPGHVGALKGLGFLAYRRGDLRAAERLLDEACQRSPADSGVRHALQRLQGVAFIESAAALPSPSVESAPTLVAVAPEATREGATPGDRPGTPLVCCDLDGLVIAGRLGGVGGAGLRAHVACEISALATAIERACQHLELGEWTTCLLDGQEQAYGIGRAGPAVLVLAEAHGEGAAGRALGMVHEEADRERARRRLDR